MLNGLDLFSGTGGLTLALSPWVRPVAYCENDRFSQGIILSRIFDLQIPNARIWDDVRTLRGSDLHVPVDIIYGGFPCQDRSLAGPRVGLDGKRSSLFWEIVRLTEELSPSFVFVENPRGTKGDAETMCEGFAKVGYEVRIGALAAAEVGANHGRDRFWILANSHRIELREQPRGSCGPYWKISALDFEPNRWAGKSGVPRMANGVQFRMDRNKALGNAVVPFQAREAFKRLMGISRENFCTV